jgi:hypothetical protein
MQTFKQKSSRAQRRAQERKMNHSLKKVRYHTVSTLVGLPPIGITDESHGIEIHIEFSNSKREGFVFLCQEETNKELVKFLENYICTMSPETKIAEMSIKFVEQFLTAYRNTENLEVITPLTQNIFSIMMAEIADLKGDVKFPLTVLATALVGVVHLGDEGEKKGIKAYRLIFDQKNRTCVTSTSTEYHLIKLSVD